MDRSRPKGPDYIVIDEKQFFWYLSNLEKSDLVKAKSEA